MFYVLHELPKSVCRWIGEYLRLSCNILCSGIFYRICLQFTDDMKHSRGIQLHASNQAICHLTGIIKKGKDIT